MRLQLENRQRRASSGESAPVVEQLVREARPRAGTTWRPGTSMARARNAHETNTVDQLRTALRSQANFLEADVRMGKGGAVMRHDKDDKSGLSATDWLRVAARSQRGVKLDFKEGRAVGPVLEQVRRAGIPQHRLIINVSPWDRGPARVSSDDIMKIRRAFPRATINLNPPEALSIAVAQGYANFGSRLGGPVMFPIELNKAQPDIIRQLRSKGAQVAVWVSRDNAVPLHDRARLTQQLRRLGVNGMIDLS